MQSDEISGESAPEAAVDPDAEAEEFTEEDVQADFPDHTTLHHSVASVSPRVHQLESFLTPVMTWMGIVYLTVIALLLPKVEGMDPNKPFEFGLFAPNVLVMVFLGVWAAFVVELVFMRVVAGKAIDSRWKKFSMLVALVPAMRMGLRPVSDPKKIFVPFAGWQPYDKLTSRRLDERFSAPMLVVAVMILPVLGMEWVYKDQLSSRPGLALALEISVRVIWLAFAVEFVVLCSAALKKVRYAKEHWLDLAIILLPLLSFLRSLRILRVGRVAKLNRLSRLYRLRGLAVKLFKTLMVLRVIERLSLGATKKRVDKLEEQLEEKLEEVEELREEIAKLKAEVAAREVVKSQKIEAKAQKRATRSGTTLPPSEPPKEEPAASVGRVSGP